VVFFILWDSAVLLSRVIESGWVEPSQTVGARTGWEYFTRQIQIEGIEYLFYFGRFDFIILNLAMICFYLGLREFLEREERKSQSLAPALLPLLPILITDIGGNVLFIVLSAMSVVTSAKLYKKDRQNPLWSYMVWLSSSYLLFSFSRSFGHILRHFLFASGNEHLWSYLDGATGSLNTAIRFLVASLTLFFVWIYKIYLKMDDDRTEIEHVNLDLTELNQELETLVAERTMALMGLTVADRIRNPAMLIGVTCKRIFDKEKKLDDDLRDVIDECKKLEIIVGDFESLLKSRRSMFRFEDINGIVRSVLTVLDKEISAKGLRLLDYLSSETLRVNMQKNLLRAAIYHVVRNAIEGTPSGGTIRVSSAREGEAIVLTFSDTGQGIPPEDLQKIFDPFYSTKQLRFGMGLPLVKQIVSEHLGDVRVQSEIGKGTTFTMVFPVRWVEKKSGVPTT
jgi:signal transduction histidine kinase